MPETKGFKDGNTIYTYVDEVARNLANPPEGNPGDVLTRTETGTEWAPPQGGGDDDAFEVVFNASLTAITSAEVGEPVTATANHTTAEIDAAFAAGKSITAKIRLTATVGGNELETVVNVFNIARVAANGATHTTFTALWVANTMGAIDVLTAVFGPSPMVMKGGEIVPE